MALVALLLATGCAQEQPLPRLSFDKEQAYLGTVPRDQWGVLTFLALNRGDAPLKLGPVEITAQQGCPAATTVEGAIEVAPGDMVLLPVRFNQHQVVGPHRLALRVPSNDPLRRVTTLTIRFTVAGDSSSPPEAAGPRLQVDKELVDGGQVPYDHPLYESFLLRNNGDAPLVLQGRPTLRVLEGC